MSSEVQTPFDGVVLVDKPAGMTSHDVVQRIRRALGTRSVGHTGTLDPLATGLMLVVVGKATRLSDYLMEAEKAYEVTVGLGRETDTWDRDGQVLKTVEIGSLTAERVREAAGELQGEFEWPVPAHSAVKRNGQKLYELARNQEAVPEVLKVMSFDPIEVIEATPDRCRARMTCSKGSYVRTWAYQLGCELGVGGCVDELRRISVGPYRVSSSVTLEALEQGERPPSAFIEMSMVLPDWPIQKVGGKDEALIRNGQIPHRLQGPLMSLILKAPDLSRAKGIRVISGDTGQLISLVLPSTTGQFRLGCVFSN